MGVAGLESERVRTQRTEVYTAHVLHRTYSDQDCSVAR
ncbi:MAG: hypothetical protein QOD83_3641, partial [Solirubrobacteraceae bacterium]|nr:hypothetical protein [Solirubrobacteraceae bacterium]